VGGSRIPLYSRRKNNVLFGNINAQFGFFKSLSKPYNQLKILSCPMPHVSLGEAIGAKVNAHGQKKQQVF